MTQNEKISKIMGWSKDSHELHILDEFNDEPEANRFAITKLLQAKMVADGWEIQMTISWQGFFLTAFSTCVDIKDVYRGHDCQNEPAALHALFCKVYNIGGEG